MNFSSHQVIYETFQKRGMGYECVISPKKISSECNNFHVIVKTDYNDYIQFYLFPSGDGHWIPDDKKLIDPWLADFLGSIIVNNY